MYQVKAIETRYKGHRFRSRLEARWAVWMDVLGVKWTYEPEGFELPSGRYLPDFWVPMLCPPEDAEGQWGSWLEVKPTMPKQRDLDRAKELARLSGHHLLLVCGNPWPGEFTGLWISHARVGNQWERVCFVDEMGLGPIGFPYGSSAVAAFSAARSARFEFGENGR